MSDVLTPQLALAYLAELQPALTGVSIFDHDGRLLAGEDVEDPATVTATSDEHAIRATTIPDAATLEALTQLDLETILADLGPQVPA